MITLTELFKEIFKGGEQIKSEQLTIDETARLLESQKVNGRCTSFRQCLMGGFSRVIDEKEVSPQGMKEFAQTVDDYGWDTAFHEVYQRKNGEMHYVDIVVPNKSKKFVDGEWQYVVNYWDSLGKIRYFVPNGEAK